VPDVVFVEGQAGTFVRDRPGELARYRRLWQQLLAVALPPDQTRRLVADLVHRVRRHRPTRRILRSSRGVEAGGPTRRPPRFEMTRSEVTPRWICTERRPRTAPGNGLCVELAMIDGGVAVRDSKDRDRGTLRFTAAGFGTFLAGIARQEFDRPADRRSTPAACGDLPPA
jgi:Domain of unknown function (DUF397)/Domain of unknown function (DUF5753)